MVLLISVVGIGISATPARADDGFDGYTTTLWNTNRCMVPNSLNHGAIVVAWTGCYRAIYPGPYPDMWWTSSSVGGGFYELRNDYNRNLCLAVPNGSRNARAIVAVCNGDNKQQWQEIKDPIYSEWGDRMLRNRYSGYCLVLEGSGKNSDPVVQWTCAPQFADEHWFFADIAG